MNGREDQLREDEIDLYQYWLAIRRHWALILVLFALGVGAGVGVNAYLPKIYRVACVVDLGEIVTGNNQKIGPVASLSDVQQMIVSGGLVRKILSALRLKENRYAAQIATGLSVESDANAANVIVKFETAEPDLGKKILRQFTDEIQNTFNYRAKTYQKARAAEIGKLNGEIGVLEAKRATAQVDIDKLKQDIEKKKKIAEVNVNVLRYEGKKAKDQIAQLKDRIQGITASRDKLRDFSATLKTNTLDLLKEKGALAQSREKEGSLASLLFSTTLQQSINFLSSDYERIKKFEVEISTCRETIDNLTALAATSEERIKETILNNDLETQNLTNQMQEKELQKDRELPAEIAKVKSEIDGLEAQKAMIEEIKIIVPPDYMDRPIKPKARTNMIMVGGFFLFVGLCLALVRGPQTSRAGVEKSTGNVHHGHGGSN